MLEQLWPLEFECWCNQIPFYVEWNGFQMDYLQHFKTSKLHEFYLGVRRHNQFR